MSLLGRHIVGKGHCKQSAQQRRCVRSRISKAVAANQQVASCVLAWASNLSVSSASDYRIDEQGRCVTLRPLCHCCSLFSSLSECACFYIDIGLKGALCSAVAGLDFLCSCLGRVVYGCPIPPCCLYRMWLCLSSVSTVVYDDVKYC